MNAKTSKKKKKKKNMINIEGSYKSLYLKKNDAKTAIKNMQNKLKILSTTIDDVKIILFISKFLDKIIYLIESPPIRVGKI